MVTVIETSFWYTVYAYFGKKVALRIYWWQFMHQFIIQVDQVHVYSTYLQLKVEVVGCMMLLLQNKSDLIYLWAQSCHHLNTITFSLSMTHTFYANTIQYNTIQCQYNNKNREIKPPDFKYTFKLYCEKEILGAVVVHGCNYSLQWHTSIS